MAASSHRCEARLRFNEQLAGDDPRRARIDVEEGAVDRLLLLGSGTAQRAFQFRPDDGALGCRTRAAHRLSMDGVLELVVQSLTGGLTWLAECLPVH